MIKVIKYMKYRIKKTFMGIKERTASYRGSASYWTVHLVAHEDFQDADASLSHFEWRNAQYPGYIELMPVSGHDGKVIVDYGCGPGNDLVGFSVFSIPKKLIGIDVSTTALDASAKRLAVHNKSAELIHIEEDSNNIPLDSESVDLIHTSGVLHHCKNFEFTIKELHRILKPEGMMQVMVYNYDSLWLHLYTAYIHQIVMGCYSQFDILEAFKRTTDGPSCPISRCYRPSAFISEVERLGFNGEFVGSAISITEMKILRKRFDAIAERSLAKEHRDFLLDLTFDEHGIPRTNGIVAGINACYILKKI